MTRGELTCAGCRALEAAGVFFTGEGPQPPFHDGCDCSRAGVSTAGLSTTAIAALQAEARRNGRRAERIVTRAWRLLRQESRHR